MKTTLFLASIAVLATAISTPLQAGDRGSHPQPERQHVTVKQTSDGLATTACKRLSIARLQMHRAMAGGTSLTPLRTVRS